MRSNKVIPGKDFVIPSLSTNSEKCCCQRPLFWKRLIQHLYLLSPFHCPAHFEHWRSVVLQPLSMGLMGLPMLADLFVISSESLGNWDGLNKRLRYGELINSLVDFKKNELKNKLYVVNSWQMHTICGLKELQPDNVALTAAWCRLKSSSSPPTKSGGNPLPEPSLLRATSSSVFSCGWTSKFQRTSPDP